MAETSTLRPGGEWEMALNQPVKLIKFGLIAKPKEAMIRARAVRPESMLVKQLANLLRPATPRGCGPLVPTPPRKRALAATADGKRRSAGQRERIDVAIEAPRLLGVAEPE
jgi:hypothetical protein